MLGLIMINETNSKIERGNDNLIACGSNDDFTATENNSISADQIRRATPQQQQFVILKG